MGSMDELLSASLRRKLEDRGIKLVEVLDRSELLGKLGGQARASTVFPEALIAELREVAKNYATPNPYKVGDLVTPRKSARMKGTGEPHIVVEAFKLPPYFSAPPNTRANSPMTGDTVDIRVIRIVDGNAIPMWGCSFEFETWVETPINSRARRRRRAVPEDPHA